MICDKCQQQNSADARFCSQCGQELAPAAQHHHGETIRHVFSDVADKINRVAGVETPSELKLREVFSNVFVKHSEEDAEKLFFVGTSYTTPQIQNVVDSWPKPWLFARVFLLAALIYFGLYLGVDYFGNLNFLPGLITLGSFLVPFTLLIFFWEMNAPQNISIYKIIKMLFVGGILSLIAAVFIYDRIGDTHSSIMIGIVEEAAKVLVVLWFLRDRKYKYILNGLLIGAAVGTGFAAFESAGYAFRVALFADLDSMYSIIFWRGVLAPGGHIVWAALSGAAICMVKGSREFSWSMLKDMRFLRIFAIVVILHALWDLPLFADADFPLVQIILTVISWVIAFAVMNAGLKEISYLKHQQEVQL
ncbi:PrsW family glutamic-type intramembrane protease [Brevibacillus fulvus]|uniref:RsiW-degrading membrane proteinase PrsW (M82 family) n=1 Tax=Brevibacillus fulvus TaxID=1125967 RepID=A0A939BV60_9BACL|nr:PrsW family glutamic-type intramembrane protease [Brevibacillus fulvus]MBM7590326.1 RsiW-degrading membrane proteinase PrsW (M82 family) [Brevibacillus fulvus]